MNKKDYKHLTQVFLLVKVTLVMMEHNKANTTFSGLEGTISEWVSMGLSMKNLHMLI